MKIRILLLSAVFTFAFVCFSFAQTPTPKREFRGAWIATVTNLDWPLSQNNPTKQKQDLINMLDSLQACNINIIVFQIRSECDAFYPSVIDPWSIYLTGSQGTAPSPYYDPLKFAIEEAHKRGMELHAWFNPYRAERSVGGYTTATNHVTRLHPDWIIRTGNLKVLNPGLLAVRQYVLSVISDVVRRYDVDGVHMDDYFYPYPPDNFTAQDDSTFLLYPRGFTNKADWRRDNVNILVKAINDSTKAIKPWVKVGMSPFGIWKYGVPPGITGLSAYDDIFCDAINWLQKRAIDYLTPQLYWKITGSQDYLKLANWWADSVAANNRHFYPGQAVYRIPTWTASELPNQIRINRANPKISGSVFFRAQSVIDNPLGFKDSLQVNLYRNPALLPKMPWLDVVVPNPINNFRFAQVPGKGYASLQWDKPNVASDGDTAVRYAVYSFDHSNIIATELDNADNLNIVTGERILSPRSPKTALATQYFVVTSLDRNYNESSMSSVVQISAPSVPTLVYPPNGGQNQPEQMWLRWNYALQATSYRLQVSKNATFDSLIVLDYPNLQDTAVSISNLDGQFTYYWRIKANNSVAKSAFSNYYNFTTGFPAQPVLVTPANASTNLPISVSFEWNAALTATYYAFQLSTTTSFDPGTVVKDTVFNVQQLSIVVGNLEYNKLYSWRVKAINAYGAGKWSVVFRFKTSPLIYVEDSKELPKEFNLEQNFPNPFNPTTEIKFSIANQANTLLKVIDLLGKEVVVLVDDNLPAGNYSISFDASRLSTGPYFYELISGDKRLLKKMLFIK